MITWLLSEPLVGMEIQCLALAELLGIEGVAKKVTRRWPWSFLPANLWPAPLHAPGPGSDPVAPPWPDLIISCGRYAAGVSMAIRRASAGRTYTIHIQDPKVASRHFDLVLAPRHDHYRGDNVILTRGSLHRITTARLQAEAARFAPTLAHLPRPVVTVLIGGGNRRYRLDAATARQIAAQLRQLTVSYGAGIALTVSRRTSPEVTATLIEELKDSPAVIWDGKGDNPYFGYLGLADYILVTCDSVNMITEACATGKPVYLLALAGGSRKIMEFHHNLIAEGVLKPYTGTLESWQHPPNDDNVAVALEIRKRCRLPLPQFRAR